MREKKVEQALTRRAKGLGGWAIKILPSVSGLPDRMVLLPGSRVIFVELKSPTGTLKPHQSVVHDRLASLGFSVEVLASIEDVDQWADRQHTPR